ncbi:hypothetical protein [Bradyrhizobium phage BDU-MI-1]|nr:hypothetical protein [Bradyrhizobium phage BDU-MI-1]
MAVSACDYMDYVNEALGIEIAVEDGAELVTNIAVAEVHRLKGIETLLRDNLDHIIGALSLMQDVDSENDREDDAKQSRDLIEKLQNLPDPDLDEDEDDDDPDYDDDGNLRPGVDHGKS